MANAAAASPSPLEYQVQRAIVLRSADAEIIAILKHTQRDILRMLRELESRPAGIGRDIREAQLRLVQRNLQYELGKAWRQIGNVTEARRAEAAARAIDYAAEVAKIRLLTGGVADGAEIADKIAQSELANAASGIDRMIARTSGASYVPLKDRVYNSEVNIGSQVDRLVNSALVRGLSAVEFAREVRQFVNPLTPGGVNYAALRLARTEINNAAHAASIQAVRESPWVDVMEWKLSGSHGRPDVCDQLARGGPKHDGRYPKTAVPSKPHPQCLCFVIPVTVDDGEFENALLSGKYDRYLDRYRNLQPGQVVRSGYGGGFPSPAPKPPAPKLKPTKTGTPAKAGAKPPSAAKPPTAAPTAKPARVSAPAPGTLAPALATEAENLAKRSIATGTSMARTRNLIAKNFNISKEEAEAIVRRASVSLPTSPAARQASLTAVKPPTPAPVRTSPPIRAHPELPWVPDSLPLSNVLPERLDIPADVKSHISSLTRKFGTRDAEQVARELEHQAGILPGEFVTRLGSIKIEADLQLSGRLVNGYFHKPYDLASRQQIHEIRLGHHLFEDRAATDQLRSEISRFKTSCGQQHTSAQSVLAHEFGHHIDSVFGDLAGRAAGRNIAEEFWGTVAKELGVAPPANASDLQLQRWFKINQRTIQSKVSGYASKNQREFFAEIWREFSGNPNARQHIRNIGLKIQELARLVGR